LAALLVRDLGLPTLISYPYDYLSLSLALVPVGVIGWMTRLRIPFAALTGALVLVWSVVAFTPVCAWMVDDLVRRDRPERADAVFVLASRLQADGDPTTAALSRLTHGLELLGQDLAPRLILSELPPPAASYGAFARQTMGRLGLEQEILTVGPVGNTHEEAVAVGRLFRERSWSRVLVVTSPYHSRRAAAALENEGLMVLASPAVETRFDLETLDRPTERLLAFSALIHEHLGLWIYARRGWVGARRGRAPGS
jgi:uncharacterized SAM-binding protein YcdF (DUF218 family)